MHHPKRRNSHQEYVMAIECLLIAGLFTIVTMAGLHILRS
jgi:hypothetical protein